MKKLFLISLLFGLLTLAGILIPLGKSQTEQTLYFDYFLNETTLIFNLESNNHITGAPIVVVKRYGNRILLSAIPNKIEGGIENKWLIGWGTGKPYNNRGIENIRACTFSGSGEVKIGNLLKGGGYPKQGDSVVFWNTTPSGFHTIKEELFSPSIWKDFAGNSIHFANVVFDSVQRLYYIFANECDTSKIDIYSAFSQDLHNWYPTNNGKPILLTSDFKSVTWCGWDEFGKIRQAPFVSDIFHWQDMWYLLLYGYDDNGVRNIGYAYAKKINDKFKINDKPILTNKRLNNWADKGVFYPKIACFNDTIYMSFTGINKNRVEHLGLAKGISLDQLNVLDKNPIIYTGSGWRNSDLSSESARIEVKNDSVFILLAGKKKWNDNLIERRFFKTAYIQEKGNVDISQLGVFLSTDGGKTFLSHANNPVLINNYNTFSKNNHSGGNLAVVITDSMIYLVQQEKATYPNKRYLVTLKGKRITR
jgi:hypothetical protein